MPVPACSCQGLPVPHAPGMNSQSGQDSFWSSSIWTGLFSEAQGTEQKIAACILKTSILLYFWQFWLWSVSGVAEVITADCSSTGRLHNTSRTPPSHTLQKTASLRQKRQPAKKNLPESEWTPSWFPHTYRWSSAFNNYKFWWACKGCVKKSKTNFRRQAPKKSSQ